jgi:serine/threonine protein kinase
MQHLQRLHREPWEGWEESLDGLDDTAEGGSLLLGGGDGIDGDGMPDAEGGADGTPLTGGSAAGSLRRKRSSRETAQRLTAAAELLQREASAKNLRAATEAEGTVAADRRAGAAAGQEARLSGGRSDGSAGSPREMAAGTASMAWGFAKGSQPVDVAAAQSGADQAALQLQQQAQKAQQPFADVPMDDTLSQLSPVVRVPVVAAPPGEASPAPGAAETSAVSITAGVAASAANGATLPAASSGATADSAAATVRPSDAEAPAAPAEPAPPSLAVSRVGLADFELLAVLGRGGYGKVMLVRRVRRAEAPAAGITPAGRMLPASAPISSPSSSAHPAALQSPGPKDEGAVYALKVLRKRDIIARDQVQRTQTERQILSALAHPFIVRLHYAFQTASKLCLVLDYLPGGDFFSLLHRGGPVSEEQAVLYGAELVLALEHLHDHGIVWRDCKPENVLLAADGHLRLTDFGLARYTPPAVPAVAAATPAGREGGWQRGGGPGASAGLASPPADGTGGGGDDSAGPSWCSSQQPHPEPATAPDAEEHDGGLELPPGLQPAYANVTRSFCGTEQYMAPEQLLQTGHNGAADWWGLGILLSELMTGRHPFRIPQPRGAGGAGGGAAAAHLDLLRNIVHPDVSPATLHLMSPVAAHLVAGLLQKDPSQRMGSPSMGGAAAVKAHPFFRYRPYPGAPYPEVLVWEKVMRKEYTPLYVPSLRASGGAVAAAAASAPAAATPGAGTAGVRPAAGGRAGAPALAGSATAFDISHFDAVFTSEPVRDSQASLPGSRESGPASASAALADTGAAAAGGNIGRPPRFAAEPSFSAFSYTRGASPPGPYDSDYEDEGDDDEEGGDDDEEADADGGETDASESGDERE